MTVACKMRTSSRLALFLPSLPRRRTQIAFQVALVLSGNLSFLNWLTALPAIFCFDDGHLACLFGTKSRSLACLASASASSSLSRRPNGSGDVGARIRTGAVGPTGATSNDGEGGGGRGVDGDFGDATSSIMGNSGRCEHAMGEHVSAMGPGRSPASGSAGAGLRRRTSTADVRLEQEW